MPQPFVVTGEIEYPGDLHFLLEGRIEAYDRDLPSLERRGRAPQLMGQSSIDGETLQFRVELMSDRTGI